VRPISLLFGVLLTIGGLVEIAIGYAISSASSCGYALSCTGPHGPLTLGGFRILFGAVVLVLGVLLIAFSLRPRRWAGRGPGGMGMYGGRYRGYGPRRMARMGPPRTCPTCGGRNGPHFQYCRFCGAALEGAPPTPAGPPRPP